MLNICICGGGSQGHISAGVIGSNSNYNVNILTRKPDLWAHDFKTVDLDGKEYLAKLDVITNNPAEIIPKVDIVLICLPGYAICEELQKIKPYIKENTIIGSVFGGSGFFLDVQKVIGKDVKAFALQRVPYTGRPLEYGHSARLKGYKPYLKVASINIADQDAIVRLLQDWYTTPVYKLSHYLEATLSNSNPLLHPCRLYVLFKDWTPNTVYKNIPFLYGDDWDDESSALWVACDDELSNIISHLPVNKQEVPTVLEYYGCENVKQLTAKMRSIVPFKGVQPHMIEVEGGYKLDNHHRYFIEDIPYGLVLIKSFAELIHVDTPNIDKVIYWAQNLMGKEYLVNGKLVGEDINEACTVTDIMKC